MMNGTEPLFSWDNKDSEFDFGLQVPEHITRAWERAPKSPHVPRHKGRKVWKRPEIRSNVPLEPQIEGQADEFRVALGDVSTNTPRAVKKQRLEKIDSAPQETKSKRPPFLTTMKDVALNTPKRKRACRQSNDATENPNAVENRIEFGPVCDIETLTTTDVDGPKSRNDSSSPKTVSELPAEASGVLDEKPELCLEPDVAASPLLDTTVSQSDNISSFEDTPLVGTPYHDNQCDSAQLETQSTWLETPKEDHSQLQPQPDTAEFQIVQLDEEEKGRESFDSLSVTHIGVSEQSPSAQRAVPDTSSAIQSQPQTPAQSKQSSDMKSASKLLVLDSPQIGTTLLRRESLRRKESPRKRGRPRQGESPQKKQLKKRDTLQEREILQKFSDDQGEEHKPRLATDKGSPTDSTIWRPLETQNDEPTPAPEETIQPEIEVSTKEPASAATLLNEETEQFQIVVDSADTSADRKPWSPASEHVRHAEGNATKEVTQTSTVLQSRNVQQIALETSADADLPIRKTRSGARFSDDTSMLKDFLSRTQAKKAANATILSPKIPKSLQESPRRSPRKVTSLHKNALLDPEHSQHATSKKHIVDRPRTPPGLPMADSQHAAYVDEQHEGEAENESTPFRRSSRMRLSAPSKTPPGVPSLIPVRRAEGTDPVVLQKTQAQELAIVTRTNTRRNKGPAKPPQQALRDIPVEETEIQERIVQETASGKAVAWAENLASYQGSQEPVDDSEEQRPRIKRVRGLGAANGTPRVNKTGAVVPPSNGTPAPKRRGRNRT